MKYIVQAVDIKYFGNLIYHKRVVNGSYVCFDQYKQHQKRNFINRCRIAGANGPILLTVPLQNGRMQKTIIRELRISRASPWQSTHWKSLVSCYNGSPWFFHFKDSLSVLFRQRFEFLIDWNLACMDWLFKQLDVKVDYRLCLAEEENMLQTLHSVNNLYISHSISRNLENEEVTYPQVFESKTGFIPGLSILDLLFCEGPKITLRHLRGNA